MCVAHKPKSLYLGDEKDISTKSALILSIVNLLYSEESRELAFGCIACTILSSSYVENYETTILRLMGYAVLGKNVPITEDIIDFCCDTLIDAMNCTKYFTNDSLIGTMYPHKMIHFQTKNILKMLKPNNIYNVFNNSTCESYYTPTENVSGVTELPLWFALNNHIFNINDYMSVDDKTTFLQTVNSCIWNCNYRKNTYPISNKELFDTISGIQKKNLVCICL
jgi:hypothetical protein